MKRSACLLAIGLAASSPVAAVAPAPEVSEPAPLTAELPALRLLNRMNDGTPAVRRLEILDAALAMLTQPTPLRGRVLCTRGATLGNLGRYDEAWRAFQLCRQLRPNDPDLMVALAMSEVERKHPVEAVQLLIRATMLSPDAVRQVRPESMETLLRQLRYAGADRPRHALTNALVSTGWSRENPGTFSSLAAVVIRERLERGDRKEALELLPAILSPKVGVGMLIDRRLAPLWPEIEKWAGPALEVQRNALLQGARAAYETSHAPDDLIAYAEALERTGHSDVAIAQLRKFLGDPASLEDAFFYNKAVIKLGHLLAETGKRAEGVALLRAALTGPASSDRSIFNIVPNLVVEMLRAKDYSGALAMLDAHTPSEANVDAAAALGYFVALRACALRGAGKDEAADEALARVQAVYPTNNEAVGIAVSCAGSRDAQAALWIADATDPETRAGALTGLAAAEYRFAQGLPAASIKGESLAQLAQREDVRKVYQRLARPLPQAYAPAAVDFDPRLTSP